MSRRMKALLGTMLVGAGLLALNTQVRADPITSQSGTIGNFTLHSSGGGVGAIVDIDLFGPFATTRRNDVMEPVPLPTIFSQHITLRVDQIDVMGPATIFHFTQTNFPVLMDVFPFPAGDVSFKYSLGIGTTISATPHGLNLEGLLGLLGNTSADDYSPFEQGGITTFAFTDAIHDLGAIITNGGDAQGSGGFSQSANPPVPEPGSMVLIALGGLPLLGGYFMRKRT
jgi:hypothetical protein